MSVDGAALEPDVNAVLFLEEALRLGGKTPTEIPRVLRQWGGPTLSSFWPPGDVRASSPDADSTAWHFRANQMRIPSAVTNRFLSAATLPEPFASMCTAPCRGNRLPRFYVGQNAFDLLAAVNFAGALDPADALNMEVRDSVAAMLERARSTGWSVEPAGARQALLRFYTEGWMELEPPAAAVEDFAYLRVGAGVEARNSAVVKLLQSTSSSSSN